MNFQELIIKKRDGYEYTRQEIEWLVKGISDHSIPDYQVSAWAMAVFFQGMSRRELGDFTSAMAYSGDVVDLSEIPGITVDKHSTGGVGDKTTLVVAPLAAAAGVPVAKMSGRGLGHTGGTIDKLESIPGFKVEISRPAFIEQVQNLGLALIAQSGNLVPADKRLYAIRDVTGTVESIPLIASSVMSKKIAAGAQGILLDVKAGKGAFMKDYQQARELARIMVDIGRDAGRRVVAVISDMSQPLGLAVGNALEVREAIETLQGRGPSDLEEICTYLAAWMLVIGGKYKELDSALEWVKQALNRGLGLAKLDEMVKAQGGKLNLDKENYGLPYAGIEYELLSPEKGFVGDLDAMQIGMAAMRLGAGREKLEDRIDHAVGVELCKKLGDPVQQGDALAKIHARSWEEAEAAGGSLLRSINIVSHQPDKQKLIFETLQ